MQRSNAAHRVRMDAGPAIFDITESDIRKASTRATSINRLRIGLAEHPSSASYDPFNLEILHFEWYGKMDINKIFLNPILMWASIFYSQPSCSSDHIYIQVLSALINGKSSVSSLRDRFTH
jgi:hypothetical protein